MSKEFVNPLEMMREAGIIPTAEQEAAWAKFSRENYATAVREILSGVSEDGNKKFSGKLLDPNKKSVNQWTERLFSLAEAFKAEMVSEEIGQRGRGTGTNTRSIITVKTPEGSLKVELTY